MSKWPENVEKGAKRLLSELFCEDESEVLADYKKHFSEILAQNIEETLKSEGEDFWKKTDKPVSEDDTVEIHDPDDTDNSSSLEKKTVKLPNTSYEANASDEMDAYRQDSEDEKNTADMITKARKNKKKRQTQWRVALSIAAVFVFLIGGTVLTRGKLRDTDRPVIPSVPVVENPDGNTGNDGLGIIDTSDIKIPEGVSAFFQDIWLFAKAVAPELICAAAGAAIGICIMKKKKKISNAPDDIEKQS